VTIGWSTSARLVLERCDALAEVSAIPDGIERVYLSPEHRAANDLTAGWMAEARMRVTEDAAGNLIGRVEGSRPGLPALVLGSHLDTVTRAGRYDGILGVLAGIATVQRLAESGVAGTLPFALEVVAFADEEGTRFGATLLGSRAFAGTWQPEWAQLAGADGVPLGEAMTRFGLDPSRIGDAARSSSELAGYLEVHIEQAPRLENTGLALGIVSGIAAARRFRITVTGQTNHCATPYELRRDALAGAAEAILAIERHSREAGTPATVGRIEAKPGGVNVIPGIAEFTLDLRAATEGERDASETAIRTLLGEITARRGLTVDVEQTHSAPEVRCAPRMRHALAAGIATTGQAEAPELLSIAGHDAMAVAAQTDVGMLFVRCGGGISHSPDESVTEDDVTAALDAFEAAVLALARAGGPAEA
jgi:allantoate deiminase